MLRCRTYFNYSRIMNPARGGRGLVGDAELEPTTLSILFQRVTSIRRDASRHVHSENDKRRPTVCRSDHRHQTT